MSVPSNYCVFQILIVLCYYGVCSGSLTCIWDVVTFFVCIFACVCLLKIGTSQELDGLSVTERITARRKERYMICFKN